MPEFAQYCYSHQYREDQIKNVFSRTRKVKRGEASSAVGERASKKSRLTPMSELDLVRAKTDCPALFVLSDGPSPLRVTMESDMTIYEWISV